MRLKRALFFFLLIGGACTRVHYQVYEFEAVKKGSSPVQVTYDFWTAGYARITIANPGDRPYLLWLNHSAYQVDSIVYPMKGNGVVADYLPLPRKTQTVLYVRDRWTPELPTSIQRKDQIVALSPSEQPRRSVAFYFKVCPMDDSKEECRWHADRFRLAKVYLMPVSFFEGRQHAHLEGRNATIYNTQPWKAPLRSHRYRKPPGHWLRTFVPTVVGVFGLIFISLAL